MKIFKAYKFRLRRNVAKEKKMAQQAGCVRFVWNETLARQKERLRNKERMLSYVETSNQLPKWKKKWPFLADVHSQPLQQKLKHLDRALKDAFDPKQPKRFPRFKKKGKNDSFTYPQRFKIDEKNSRVYLPKIGWVRYRSSRLIEGKPKNLTVSRRGEHWYVSIQTEMEIEDPKHPSVTEIGIDMGVAKFATLSNGETILPLNSFRKHESRLAKSQKKLSRKKKYSKNWRKQKVDVSRIHIQVADSRKDFLHKASTTISKNHAVVHIEDLKVSNMSESAKGTEEEPGGNIRAKACLNKSILDQGWFEFRQQLEYKQKWRGGDVIVVAPMYTSQTCSACGNVDRENRKSQALFECVCCGYKENADLNAAKNILRAGQARMACGSNSNGSRKQEPTEREAFAFA
jgi:putative transposase